MLSNQKKQQTLKPNPHSYDRKGGQTNNKKLIVKKSYLWYNLIQKERYK